MNWLRRWLSARLFPELVRVKMEQNHMRRIASALAAEITLSEMAELVVEECKNALGADATCVFLKQDDDGYTMLAERGCTVSFKTSWRRIPSQFLPHLGLNIAENLFVGTGEDLKKRVPEGAALIDASGRKVIAYAPMSVNGRPIGLVGFSYNHNLKHKLDQSFVLTIVDFCAQALERVRLSECEQAARRQAEDANRAKTEFLANISHEIRTPIGVIQGFVDLLLESGSLNPSQRHWASVIRRNTQQLTGLVGEVLDISKIEAEKIEIETIEFRLRELLEDVCTAAEFKAEEKGIQFLYECGEVPEWVRSDPTRLRQILMNLVGNAIKFTVQGHVKVRVSCAHGSRLEVEVRDTGIGIPSEKQGAVFEPFIQADTSTKRHFGGTGLGLTIAKRLALAMGGDVCLRESTPGEGSTFHFQMRLERCESPASSVGEKSTATAMREGHELEGLKILLVEDSIDNQDLICSLLARAGARVDVADSGASGVSKAMSEHYNVVLMDIQMPGLDGHQAVARLRAQGYNRPIAALTAHVLSSERQKSLREGFDDYLTKPIDRARLIRSVQRLGYLGAS